MPPLSLERRAEVARLILGGHSYDEVSELSDVSRYLAVFLCISSSLKPKSDSTA